MRVRGEASSVSQRQGCGEVTAFQDLRVGDRGQHLQATSGCQAHEDWLEAIEAMNKLEYEKMKVLN